MKIFKNKKGESVSETIGAEIVDEFLEAGLSIVLLVFGVSYFNLESRWVDAAELLGHKFGGGAFEELKLMIGTISNSFPFNFIGQYQNTGLVIGLALVFFGVLVKVMTVKTMPEFIKDIGKVIMLPGIIGVVAIIIIQLFTVSSVNDVIARGQLAQSQLALQQIDPAVALLNLMGLMLYIGIVGILVGSLLSYISKSLGHKPAFLYVMAKFSVFVGWFSLIYYLVIRLLASQAVTDILYGKSILLLFAFSWYVARGPFLVSLCMFGFGLGLYKYGTIQLKRAKKEMLKSKMETELPRKLEPRKFI